MSSKESAYYLLRLELCDELVGRDVAICLLGRGGRKKRGRSHLAYANENESAQVSKSQELLPHL